MCKRTGGGGVVIKLTFIKITSQNETFGSDYFLYHFYNKGLKQEKKVWQKKNLAYLRGH